ncbi:HAD family hydrolase [uncultured Chitinophaga sp.]|jgi:Predicted hydrolases of the HAD superfamily|uniref:HAD family hydrolase n=1 Tax=uncultured Chitinophaga sp. TaxID=339340 RepID=UPI002633FF0A|nr:HAD family hydrolase [uncultured Chitinophaga sp.]
MLLATDLDGTFLGGSPEDKAQLYSWLKQQTDVSLVFVTGRGLANVQPLLEDPQMPLPDYIICDVGATVVSGSSLEPVQPLQAAIEEKWPGAAMVRAQLEQVAGLRYQDVPQQRRCSFYYDATTPVDVASAIAIGLGCDVLQSAGKYLDILPAGVNKGSTLIQLLELLGYPADEVLVAGDTMNDRSLYDTGLKGVVVGLAEAALLQYTLPFSHVLQSEKPGAAGIMEGISWFTSGKEKRS